MRVYHPRRRTVARPSLVLLVAQTVLKRGQYLCARPDRSRPGDYWRFRQATETITLSFRIAQHETFDMIRYAVAIALLATSGAPSMALAQSAVLAAASYSTADTDIGTLLDDPASKAVLDKVLPGFSTNPQIDMARSMTMKSIQAYAADQLTDEKLAAVDAELAKLPPKK
jgi:hypothetical protein